MAANELTTVPSHPTILVVEDEQAILEIITFFLEDEGYQVLQALNGEAALSLLEEARPDLIISDIRMPGMDGFAFCEEVRANPDFGQLPFIFLTGRDERADVRRGMGLGADDYLTKPFEPEELLSAVQVRLARAAETQAAIVRAGSGLQDQIIQSLTHEFRTPLSLVVGYTELLESTGQDLHEGDFESVMTGLHAGSRRLVSLVEDFLLLSKLRTGAIAEEVAEQSPAAIFPDMMVRIAAGQVSDAAADKNVTLPIECAAPDLTVRISRQHLGDIVTRLLDNAIKFSKREGGRVVVMTAQEQDSWVLSVADEGIGIREEAHVWIFEAFQQVDRARMEQQGTGVGLTIVKGLVEIYGGRIDLESTPGVGSTFSVWLPIAFE
ncbi:MAG: response regulator [Anaerolineae bacterium]|nr:response regulator [Anaerolineae bacterium]